MTGSHSVWETRKPYKYCIWVDKQLFKNICYLLLTLIALDNSHQATQRFAPVSMMTIRLLHNTPRPALPDREQLKWTRPCKEARIKWEWSIWGEAFAFPNTIDKYLVMLFILMKWVYGRLKGNNIHTCFFNWMCASPMSANVWGK